MNSRSRSGGWKRLLLCALLFLPLFDLLFCWSLLSPVARWGLLCVAIFCIPLALALLSMLICGEIPPSLAFEPAAQSVAFEDVLPFIPRTLEAAQRMDPESFEFLAAAVLVAMGEGYHFVEHCGKSGDQGVDVRLLNAINCPVVVQCKRNADDNHVGQPELRDFLGSIQLHRAVYGIFVTTSTFTPAALQLIASHRRLIRAIDGQRLEWYLQHRSRDVALALDAILGGVYS